MIKFSQRKAQRISGRDKSPFLVLIHFPLSVERSEERKIIEVSVGILYLGPGIKDFCKIDLVSR